MSSPGNTPASGRGATPVGGGSSRPKWLVPLLIAVVVLIALLLLLTQCGGDDDDDASNTPGTSTSTAATTAPAVTSAAAAPSASSTGPAGEAGTVTAGGEDLMMNLTAAGLKAYDGQEATGNAVEVQSVPADEGFWIGSSETDRLWIQLTDTGGESDYKVKQGDQVGFTGTVTKAADGFAAKTGLTAPEGADQLTKQGYYLSVKASSVKLSR